MDIAKLDTTAYTRSSGAPVETRPRAPAPAAAPAQGTAQPADARALASAIESANAYIQSQQASSIQFALDRDSGRTIVKMVDVETQEVLRQIPSEEMLAISHAIDRMRGLVIDEKA